MPSEKTNSFAGECDHCRLVFLVSSFLVIAAFAFGSCSFVRSIVIERISQKALLLASVAATSVPSEGHIKAYEGMSLVSAEYLAIQRTLRAIKQRANEAGITVDYIYTLAPHSEDDSCVVFVVDAEDSARDRSKIGEVMKSLHHGANHSINIKKAEVEPIFVEDQHGRWLSAHAPIKAPDGSVVGAVGLDLDAKRIEQLVLAYQIYFGIGSFALWVLLCCIYLILQNNLVGSHKKLEDNLRLGIALAGYVGTKGYLQALKDGKVVPRKRRITVMFVDIRGFTAISDNLEPAKSMELVNDFLQVMVPMVHKNQGFIDKYIGDGFMAAWGTLDDDEQHAEHAVCAALAMLEALPQVKRTEAWKSYSAIEIGIGIDTGHVAVGNIGIDTHFEFTAIGDIVNTASRLEALTKQEKSSILVTENVYADSRTVFDFECIGGRQVRGRTDEIKIYRPTGMKTLPKATV